MIRFLKTSDLSAVSDLGFGTYTRADFQFFLSHGCAHNMGVFAENKLVAFALGVLVKGELDIIALTVREDLRRTGLASQLLKYWFTEKRIKKAFLEVDEENGAALALYHKFGFNHTGRRKKYYQGTKDAIVMEWELKETTQSIPATSNPSPTARPTVFRRAKSEQLDLTNPAPDTRVGTAISAEAGEF